MRIANRSEKGGHAGNYARLRAIFASELSDHAARLYHCKRLLVYGISVYLIFSSEVLFVCAASQVSGASLAGC